MPPFGRVLTAMITPFTDDGAVDHERARRLARFLVGHGSDGLVVTGTTGESPVLSNDEKVALYRTVVEAVEGRGLVVAGTGTYDTAESVHLTERAARTGVHGVLAVTPYYSRPPQAGLLAHFRAIADATDLPVMLYNIPSRTARLIEIPTLAELAEHPRIVAVKDAVGDSQFTSDTVAAAPGLAVYSGDDHSTLAMMRLGAVGVVSVAAHLAGVQVKRLVEAAAAGDLAEAERLDDGLRPLFEALFLEPNPIPVKAAMAAMWEPVGEPRLPLVAARPETVQTVKEALGRAQGL